MVCNVEARVFKPKAMIKCKCCGDIGPLTGDSKCVARAPPKIAASIEPFRGEMNPLSNLHICAEGCQIPDGSYDFPSSEHHYQFKRLHAHGLVDESYWVLEADTGYDAMKIAQCTLPEEDVKPEWRDHAVEEMLKPTG